MTSTDEGLRLFGTLEPAPVIVRGVAYLLRDGIVNLPPVVLQ
jgi:hypothetical protein